MKLGDKGVDNPFRYSMILIHFERKRYAINISMIFDHVSIIINLMFLLCSIFVFFRDKI